MQTANQNPEPSTVAAPGVSPVRSALAYVALAFAFSWLLWMLVIKAHGREAFLYFGEAGPAVAAIALSIRRQRDLSSSRIQRVVWFISMLALCWIVLSLHYLGQAGAGLHFRPDPILIVPAVLPAWVRSLAWLCSSFGQPTRSSMGVCGDLTGNSQPTTRFAEPTWRRNATASVGRFCHHFHNHRLFRRCIQFQLTAPRQLNFLRAFRDGR